LYGKSVDLIEAAQEAKVVINNMGAERGDPSVWKEVYEWGKQILAEFDIEPNMPRTTGRQQHRASVPATNPESYWQRAVYLPLIDHLIQDMNDRLLSQEDRFLGQYLLPTRLQGLSNDVQDKMYAAYKDDLTE